MSELTAEQRVAARKFFAKNQFAPPYDNELDELAKILHTDPRQSAAESLAAALREMLEFYNRPFSKTSRFEAGNNARAALAAWDKLK